MATGTVWMGAENIDSTGTRSPDHAACIKSLYRLRYPGPQYTIEERRNSYRVLVDKYWKLADTIGEEEDRD